MTPNATAASSAPAELRALAVGVLPVAAVVFIVFFVIGLAMPVLPLQVHQRLGFGAFIVGLVAGSQFTASLFSRLWAGAFADTRGGRRAVLIGLGLSAAAGVLYLLSLPLMDRPGLSATVLILGRGVLGAGESFIVTGSLGWTLALSGPRHAGKVLSWIGLAMYAAYALGAPVGSAVYGAHGFVGVGIATLAAPLAALALVLPLRAPGPTGRASPPFRSVWGAVRTPGLALALSSIAFGAVSIFVALLFAAQRWPAAWGAFTALSGAFMLSRVLFGHLPDRMGGAKVALISVIVEAAGQALIWRAHSPAMVFAGAGLTGLGYSMVYPALGIEAMREAPAASRALVLGTFTACLDLALGVGGPALGAVANGLGLRSVFLVAAMVVLCAAPVCLVLMRRVGRAATVQAG